MPIPLLVALTCVLSVDLPSAPLRAPATPPSAEELGQRRSLLAEAVGDGVVVVEAHGGENEEVTRNFWYLTSLESAGGRLIISCRAGVGEAILFLPEHDPGWEMWNGPRAHPGKEALERTGIDRILALDKYPQALVEPLEGGRSLLMIRRRGRVEPRWLDQLRQSGWEGEAGDARQALHPLRQVKSPWEMEQLRKAIAITHRGLRAGARRAAPGRWEFEVEAAIEGTFHSFGSPAPGFPSIVGSGPNSCVLHYNASRRRIEEGELLVMDVGARSGPYTADITRTVPVSGVFSERQRQVFEVVRRAQAAGIAAVRPGATISDIDRAAREVVREEGFGEFFPHGTSHHVGLDVHDVGPRRPLIAGMVVTVEPGIYIAAEGLGVRIEDMVLVTAEGCEVLSAAIPKEAEAMERWVKAGQATPF